MVGKTIMPKRGQCGFAHFLFVPILLLALVCGQGALAGQTDHQAGVVQAIHIDTPIRIDGRLTESAWRKAMPVTHFRQREPREGEPATERTEVRILFDNQNLYLGVRCFDAQPQLIIAKEMETDGRLSLDDNFTVILDTYHDYRSGFYFQINPNAAKLDAQLGDGGDSFNRNWNGIWDVRARITPEGWEAEIILPFKTLRFSEKETQTWGINFRRFIRRKNEEDLWQAWHRNQGIRQLSAEGTLLLPWPVKRGKNLELKPYMTSGFQAGNPAYGYRNDQQWKTGLDAKYAITPTLTADLTLHTDFAQVEADRARINLTRFSLFFPEKRDFFLESESNFSFGAS
ncbi:MAG: hypothetical protein D6751_11530 [Deltaproteobacteria bacterium]|nr:MAG: hypothetical protein D6751_11530 [Deltaproteobacteria bacterium]